MNRAVLASELDYKWRRIGFTENTSPTFYFDRWRLYTPKSYTKVAIFDLNVFAYTENGIDYIAGTPIREPQVFSNINSFEHTFSFDLTDNASGLYILAISSIPIGATFEQVYAFPTGFGATRNSDAKMTSWHFDSCNPEDYIQLNNNPLTIINNNGQVIRALHVRVQNTFLSSSQIDDVIIWRDNNGKSGGSLNYSGCTNITSGAPQNPTFASRAAYDSLQAKGCVITGVAPPTS